ncbi:MAG: hypothetical protein WB662_15605 [Methyloceanibacter sp.]|jgi:hypothetical protein
MHKSLIGLFLAFLLAAALGAMPVTEAKAGAAGSVATAIQHQPLVRPAVTWRDCQRIARCYGCAPVYHCRSCGYQRKCLRGLCEWADVCVWGPYLPVAPRGVPIR